MARNLFTLVENFCSWRHKKAAFFARLSGSISGVQREPGVYVTLWDSRQLRQDDSENDFVPRAGIRKNKSLPESAGICRLQERRL